MIIVLVYRVFIWTSVVGCYVFLDEIYMVFFAGAVVTNVSFLFFNCGLLHVFSGWLNAYPCNDAKQLIKFAQCVALVVKIVYFTQFMWIVGAYSRRDL